MQEKLLSIQQAAKRLKVSTKTLRRWEAKGILVPSRTSGAHRRYTEEQIINFHETLKSSKKVHVSAPQNPTPLQNVEIDEAPTNTSNNTGEDFETSKVFYQGIKTPAPAIGPATQNTGKEILVDVVSVTDRDIPTESPSEGVSNDLPEPNRSNKKTSLQKIHFDRFRALLTYPIESVKDKFTTFTSLPKGVQLGFGVLFLLFLLGSSVALLETDKESVYISASDQVLATTSRALKGSFNVNVPAYFNDFVNIRNDITVDGTTTLNGDVFIRGERLEIESDVIAPNLVYSVTAGDGISVTGTQDLVIENTGVTSFQGQTGEVTLTAGSNITISGTTISANVPSSDKFKTVSDGTNSFSASGDDTLTLLSGTGISLTTDTTNKKITINNTSTGTVTGVGNGLALSSGIVSVSLLSAQSGSGSTSSFSGLQFAGANNQLTLLQGCGNGQLLKFNTGTNVWECATDDGGASGIIIVEENDVQLTSSASTLDFLGSDFNLTESPVGEVNVAIDYANSGITRRGQNETISGNWTFSSASPISFSNASPSIAITNTGSLLFTDGTNTLLTIADGGTQANVTGIANLSATGTITLGTVTSGTWNGTAIGSQYGGTGQNFSSSTGVPTLSSGTWSVSAQLSAQRGGTGIDTSSSTGVPSISGGTWSVNSTLSPGLGGTGQNFSASTGVITVSSGTFAASSTLATSLGGLGANVTAVGAGELLYSTGATTYDSLAAGNSGECLTSGGAGAPVWTSCAGATGITTYWDLVSGALTPKNQTLDLLVGGTSTASAKFAILGVNNARGSQTATLSGSLTLDAAGSIQTTNNQTLTIGGNQTGNINFFNSSNILTSGGALTLAGTINANTTSTINGLSINSGTITSGTWNGSAIGSQYGGTGQNFSSSTGVPTLSSGTWSVSAQLSAQRGGTGIDTSSSTGVPSLSSGTWSVNATLAPSLGGTGQNFSSSTGVITVSSGTFAASSTLATSLGGLGADVSAVGAGELLYSTGASAYDSLAAGNSGECLTSGGAGAPVWTSCAGATGIVTYWDLVSGALTPKNSTVDLLVGGTSTASAKFAILGVNNARGSQTATLSGSLTLDAAGSIQTTNSQTLSIGGGSTGNITLGQSGKTITLPGYTGQNGILYATQTTGVLSQVTTASSGLCLLSGASSPTWSTCPAGSGFTQWELANGAIYSGNTTLDLLLGGVTTESAKFAFIGVNNARGTQTASISGNLVLDTAASIQTTNNQTLTVGGSTTGNLNFFNSSNILTPGGALTLAGTINANTTNTINGLSINGGTITSGTWNGSAIGSQYGGTGQNFSSSTGVPSLSSGTWSVNATLAPSLGGTGQNFSSSTGVITVSSGTFAASSTLATSLGGLGANVSAVGAGELLYSTGATTYDSLAAGNSGECLTSGGAGAPVWTSCAGATGIVTYWDLVSGALTPKNSTVDLLVGGTSTASAKFAITNINGSRGTQVATLSGSLTLDAAGSLQTTNGQTLTLGAGTTGNLIIGQSGKTITLPGYTGQNGILYATQTAGVLSQATTGTPGQCLISGASSPIWGACDGSSSVNIFSLSNGAIIPGNETVDFLIGGVSSASAKFAVLNINGARGTQTASISGSITLDSAGAIQTTNNQTLTVGGSTTGNLNFFNSSNILTSGGALTLAGVINANTTNTINSLSINGGTITSGTWNGTAIGSQYGGTGQNFSSSTGVPSLSSGTWSVNATLSTSLGGLGANVTAVGAGELLYSTGASAYDSLAAGVSGQCLTSGGAGAPIWTDCSAAVGNGASKWSISAGAITTNIPSLDLLLGGSTTASARFAFIGVATDNPVASISASNGRALSISHDGTIQTTLNQTLAVGGGNTGNLVLGQSSKSIILPGYTGQNGVLYGTQTTGVLAQATTATSGQCLVSGASNPTWTDCAGATGIVTYWDLVSGALTPKNSTLDLLVGGTSTSSAKFAITNINGSRGTQVATLSGSLTLDATGLVQTTNNQTLTLGGGTSGNIIIGQSGKDIILPNFTGQNSVLFAAQTTGVLSGVTTSTSGLCLVSGASNPTWSDCAASASDDWNVSNGVITPKLASTLDLLLGGVSTETAKFAFIGVNEARGTQTASISGNLVLDTSASIQTTRNQTLTIGGSTTGNLNFFNSSNILTPGGALTLAGVINANTTNTINGLSINGGTITSGTWNGTAIGSQYGGTGQNFSSSTGVPSLSSGTWSVNATLAPSLGGTGLNTSSSTGVPSISSGTWSVAATLATTLGGLGGNVTAVGAGELLYSTGASTYDSLAAGNNGECLVSGGAGAPVWTNCSNAANDDWDLVSGALSPKYASTVDLLVGGTSTSSAKFAITNIIGSRGTQTATLSGSLTLDAAGSIQTTNNQTLTIGGNTTGNINFFNVSNRLTSGGALTLAGTINANTTNTINGLSINAGTITSGTWNGSAIGSQYGGTGQNFSSSTGVPSLSGGTWSVNATLATSLGGLGADVSAVGAGELLYSTGASTYDSLAAGNSGECLVSGGAGSPVWTNCSNAANDDWDLVSGALSPKYASTVDLLVGGTSTSSAKFAITNIIGSRGTQTATLSGSLTLDAAGSLQTTNNQTLTIGAGTTGDLYIGRASQNLFLPGFTTNGGILYTTSTGLLSQLGSGSTGQCLIANTGSAPTWGPCDGAQSVNVWDIVLGSAQLANTTLDLLVGGTATTSAKFAILGVNNARGSQTATLSGSLTLDAAGSLQTTNNQTLTIGGNTTGDISLSPRGGAGAVTVNGSLNAKTGRGVTITVAASNSNTASKNQADYVADGTDDDATIETAITALPATGGTVVLLEGTYVIDSDGIDITDSNVSLIGQGRGTILQRGYDTASNDGVITATTVSGITISDLAIDGVKGTYAGTENIGIYFSSSVTYSTIRNTYIHDNDGSGVQIVSSSYVNVIGSDVRSNDSAGVYLDTVNNSNITNNNIQSNASVSGIYLDSSTYNILASNNVQSNFYNIYLDINSDNNTVSNNNLQSSTSYGIRTSASSTENIITNNYIKSSGADGILLQGGGNTVSSNIIYEVGASTNYDGIDVGSSDNNIISSNRIIDSSGSGYGINVSSSTSDNNYISGNEISGAGFIQKIQDLGTGTTIQQRDQFVVEGSNPGKALLTLNQQNTTFDILAASSSGTTVFRLTNAGIASSSAGFTINGIGNIQSTNNQTLTIGGGSTGDLIIGRASQATYLPGFANCTLKTGTGGALTCGTDIDTYSYSPFQESLGSIFANNSTLDLLLGGSTTESAKFAFIGSNLSRGNQIASISGSLTLDATGSIQSTRNQTLTLGGGSTGDISMPLLNTKGFTITSDLSGGSRSTDVLTISQSNNGSNNSTGNLLQLTNSDTGSTVALLDISQAAGTGINMNVASTGINFSQYSSGTAIFMDQVDGSGNGLYVQSDTSGGFSTSFTGDLIKTLQQRNLTSSFSINDTGNNLDIARANIVNNSGASFTISGDLATFSSNCTQTAGTCTDTSNVLRLTQNFGLASGAVLNIVNQGLGSAAAILSNSGGQAALILNKTGNAGDILTASASGVTKLSLDLSGNLTVAGVASAAGGLTINGVGQVQSTNNQTLTIGGGSTGDLVIGRTSQAVYLPGFTTNQNSIMYTGAGGRLSAATTTNDGYCLKSSSGGTPSWGTCDAGASVNVFESANGTIRQTNTTLDLLIGGMATESAKFAILGVNNARGSQTATLSGSLTLDAAGSIQTTNNQTLTIGGNTTGNILINPSGSLQFFNSNNFITSGGALTLSGTITANTTNTINGVSINAGDITGASLSLTDNTNQLVLGTGNTGTLTLASLGGSRVYTLPDATGTFCLNSNNCGYALGTNYWQLNSNLLSPINSTFDFAIGGTATTSAKFAVLNIAGGTPTASVSAGTSGGTYITATGNLQTTAKQSLTLGGGDTGNIVLSGFSTGIVKSNASGVLSSSAVNLASSDVTGFLPFANGGSPWIQTDSLGTLTPRNNTLDILLGGTSTASAKFAFINIAGGTPTASISAGTNGAINLTANGVFSTTNMQTLTLGNATTGNIAIQPAATESGLLVTTNGLVGIGSHLPSYKLDLLANVGNQVRIGYNASNYYLTDVSSSGLVSFNAVGAGALFNFQDTVTLGVAGSLDGQLTFNSSGGGETAPTITANSTGDLTLSAPTGSVIVGSGTGNININPGTDNVVMNLTSGNFYAQKNGSNLLAIQSSGTLPVASIAGVTSFAAALVDNSGVGDIFTASKSGATKFTITNAGNLIANNYSNCTLKTDSSGLFTCGTDLQGTGGGSSNWVLTAANGTLNPINNTLDLLVGGTSSESAKFAILGVAGARGTQTATLSGSLTLDAAGNIQSTRNQTLTLGGGSTGDLYIGRSSQNLFLPNFTTVGGLLYTTSTGLLSQLGTGSTGQCLNGNTGAAPSWGTCDGSASVNVFEFANGTARTTNQTVDFLIGGLSTSSAKFAITGINNARGQQTASVSGNLVLDSAGNIQTTNSQTLTIGGNTTGNIDISPKSGSGTVTVNGTLAAKTGRVATVTVAASNSATIEKLQADYVAAGSSDHTTINNAITSLPSGGGIVQLLSGSFVLSGAINIPSNVTLRGVGESTIITIANGYDTSINFISNSDTSGGNTQITVANMTLDGNKNNQTTGTMRGIRFDSVGSGSGTSAIAGARVENVIVKNFRNEGISLTETVNSIITKNSVINNTSFGIHLTSTGTFSHRNTISNNIVQGNSNHGIIIHSGTYNAVSSNVVDTNSGDGINLQGTTPSYNTVSGNTVTGNSNQGIDITSGTYNLITGNNVSASSSHNIQLSGATYNTVTGNVSSGSTGGHGIVLGSSSYNSISGNASTANSSDGINLQSTSDNNSVVANTSSGNTGNGIEINNSSTNTVSGNKLYDNGSSSSTDSLLVFSGASNNLITSNDITDTAGTGQAIDINGSTCSNNYLADNRYSGTGASTISDTGTGTIYGGQLANNGSDLLFNSSRYLGIGTTSPQGILHVSGGNIGGNAAFIVNQTGATTNDIFTASSSGVTKFTIKNDGTASSSAGFTINGIGSLQSTNNQTLTIGGNSTGNIVLSPLNSAAGSFILPGADNTVSLGSSPSARFKDLFLGNNSLHIICTTGDGCAQTVDYSFGVDTTSGDFRIGVNGNPGNANAALTLTQGGRVNISGTLNVAGNVVTSNGTGATISSAACVTTQNGIVVGSADCPISTSPFALTSGTIIERNTTADLLIGGVSTESAKFAILGVNNARGTQTATLSGNLVLDAASSIQTTRNQTLTLGGGSTGDLVIGRTSQAVYLPGFTTNQNSIMYTGAGGLLSAATTTNNGYCLKSSSGGTPTWGTCDAPSSVNVWDAGDGVIRPGNTTYDLLVGGISSSSAAFRVTGQGNPFAGTLSAASVSANTSFAGLVVDNRGVGDLFTASSSGLTRFVINNNGNIGIGGNPTSEKLLVQGGSTGSVLRIKTPSTSAGNANLILDRGTSTDGEARIFYQTDGVNNWAVGMPSLGTSFRILQFTGGVSNATPAVYITTNNLLAIGAAGTASPLYVTHPITGTGWSATGKALAVFDQIENQDILAASASGVAKFSIGRNGELGVVGGGSISFGNSGECLKSLGVGSGATWTTCDVAASVNTFEFANGTVRTTNQTTDLLIGGVSTDSAKFAILGVNNARGSQTATLSGNLVLDAAGSLQTTNNQTLTVGGGSTGDLVIGRASQTLTLPGFTTCTLKTTSGGLLSCGSDNDTNFWQYNASTGIVANGNLTTDLLLGGTSTSSAKFAFTNVAGSLSPIASISATTDSGGNGNGIVLSADGSIQTVRNNTLTLGGNTTGNIAVPLSNWKGLNLTSDLSAGARSTGVLTITQANNGSFNSTGNLLYIANTDTGSTQYVVGINNDVSGGNGLDIDIGGSTLGNTGVGINIAQSSGAIGIYNPSILTTGTAIDLSSSLNGGGSLYNFSGNILKIAQTRDFSSSGVMTDSGNYINTRRANTVSGGGTFNLTGDLVTFSSNCTETSGTCVDPSNILQLTQNYSKATGAVLNIENFGIGSAAAILSNSGGQAAFILNKTGNAGDIFTASASGVTKFNIGLDGTASSSAGFTIDGIGNIQSTNSQTLTLGGSTTGMINIANKAGSTFTAFDTVNSRVGIGLSTPNSSLHIVNTSGGTTTTALTIGNGSTTNNTGSRIAFNISNLTAGTQAAIDAVRTNSPSAQYTYLSFSTLGPLALSERMRISELGYVGIGTNGTPTSELHVTRPLVWGATGKALAIFDQIENQDIFTASASGVTKFTIKNDGTASSSAGFTIDGIGSLQSTNNQTLTLGGDSTGNINLLPKNGTGSVFITSTTTSTTFPALKLNTASGGTAINITGPSNGKGLYIASSFTTGTAIDLNAIAGTLSTGYGINIAGTGSQNNSFTGGYININTTRNNTFAGTVTDTGNHLNLTRVSDVNNSTGVLNVVGDLSSLSSNCTVTSGTCVDTSNILQLQQNYGLASGAVLNIENFGIGSAAAILSNSGGQAAFILNKTGNAGDIFTASASGVTKFSLGLAGEIGVIGGGTLSYGNGGECLKSLGVGSGATWGSCATGAGSNWDISSGTITPKLSSTLDLLIGGTSTASAKFAVLNIDGTATPVASVSATSGTDATKGIYIKGDGSIQSVRNNTLTIGGDTTGNIQLSPGNNTGRLLLGNISTSNLNSSYFSIDSTATNYTSGLGLRDANTGDAGPRINFINNQGNQARIIFNSSTATQYGGANALNIIGAGGPINFGAVAGGPQTAVTYTISGLVGLGTTSPISELHVTRPISGNNFSPTGKALAIFDQIENQDIFTASAAGTTRFVINRNGQVGINTGQNNSSLLSSLDVRANSVNGGTISVASVSGATSHAGLIVDNSGSGDLITASSSGLTRFVVKQNGVVQIGNDTNGIVFDYLNQGPRYTGTARPLKSIHLIAEYPGATLTASGAATLITGSMTSDASASGQLGNFMNYYEWSSSQTSLNSYNVSVRVKLPSDFSAWPTSTAAAQIKFNTELNSSDTNKLDVFIYNGTFSGMTAAQAATPVVYRQNQFASSKTWTNINITGTQLDSGAANDIDAAGEEMIIMLKMSSKDNNHVQVGDITLNYLSAF